MRHLFAFSSDAWTPGKPEVDLSAPSKSDCIAGVPKGSPDGTRILLFLFCSADPTRTGVTMTDTAGSAWTFLGEGFGPDWNPAGAGNRRERPVDPNPRRRAQRLVFPR